MSQLKLQILLGAVDKMTAPLKAVSGQSRLTAKDLADTKKRIRDLEKQSGEIDGYRKLGGQIGVTRAELTKAQSEAQRMAQAMASATNQTKAMTRDLVQARQRVRDLTTQERELIAKHNGMRQAFAASGISTKQLGAAQRQLKQDLASANAQLTQQKERLAAASAQQQRYASARATYDKAMSARGALAGTGAGAVAMGGAALYKGWNIASKAMGFEQEMSKVQALTRLGDNSVDLAALTAQARELGAKTAYTAGEAAQGQGFLAMAGFSPKAIRDAMPGVLDLAKAGGVEIAQASDIGSNILTGFKLPAAAMSKLGDVMVGTFTRSNVNLEMLGDTMKYVAPVAANLGVDLETASAMAGKLGDAGIQGSMGGTALRAILSRLASPPKAAAKALDELGIKATDAKGNLRQLPDILEEINKKTAKMGDAKRAGLMKAIAGEEAFSALAVLSEQAGNGKLQELIGTLRQAGGEAGKVSRTMANNALGDLDNLSSAWDDVGIQMMQTERGPFRELLQTTTQIIGKVGDWMRANPQLTSTIIRIGAAISVAAVVGGSLMLVIASLIGPFAMLRLGMSYAMIAAGPLMTALRMLSGAFIRLGIALLTTPVGWFIAAIALIAGGAYLIYKNWDKIGPWFAQAWATVKSVTAEFWDWMKSLPDMALATGQAILQGLIDGIMSKWQALKDTIKQVTSYLPDWMTGSGSVQVTTATPAYAGGGGLAAPGASGYGAAFYQPKPLATAGRNVTHVNAPISITQQPGQSSADLAQEIDKRLQLRERQASARQRSSLRDIN